MYTAKPVCACSVAQACSTLCNPMDCNLPGSSVHANFQARTLEQVAISYSRGSSQPRNQNCASCVSCIGRRLFTTEPPQSFLFFPLFQPSTTVLLMVSEASMIWPLDPSDPITHPLQPHWALYCSFNPPGIHLL